MESALKISKQELDELIREGVVQHAKAMCFKIQANSDQELLEALTLQGCEKEEVFQLIPFLKFLAANGEIKYPFQCIHHPEVTPDFTLIMHPLRVGLEVTTLTDPRLERARSRPDKSFRGTIVTTFLKASRVTRKGSKNLPLLKNTRTQDPQRLPPTIEELHNSWLEAVWAMVVCKTEIMNKPEFKRGDENWLLLTDRLSTGPNDYYRLRPLLRDKLEGYWRGSQTFTKVIVQYGISGEHFTISG